MKTSPLLSLLLILLILSSCDRISERQERKGDYYLKIKDRTKAISYYSKAIKFNNKNTTALHSLGRIYEDNGDYANAKILYSQAIDSDSTFALGYRSLGYIKYKLDDLSGAIEDYEKSIRLDSLNSTAFSNSAFIFEKLKNFNKARSFYYKAIKLNANHFGDMARLADLEFDLKNYDSCFILCRRVIGHLTENKDSPYGTLGLYYIVHEQWDSAIVNLNKAINLKPNWSHYYNNRGYSLAGQKKYSSAIKDYDKAIQLDSLNSSNVLNRADSYYLLGEFEKANRDYSKAIELSLRFKENPGICYYNRSSAKKAIGDINGMNQDLELAKQNGYPDNYQQFVDHDSADENEK
jgi:tetratricopeptide (TPR) repeat protein